MRRIFATSLVFLVTLGALESGHAANTATGLDVHVGPPAAHHLLGNPGVATKSWLERTVNFTGSGLVVAQVFVDSQASDRLELLVDGTVVASMSGFHRTGQLGANVAAGSHTIRIQYTKDAMADEGLDTAWVDNVRVFSNNQLLEESSFSNAVGCSIPGWTRGGEGGGWCATVGPEHREMRRPLAMAYGGYQPGPRVASMVREYKWPTVGSKNEFRVKYFVDSEEGHDFFRILVDGTAQFQISGRQQLGEAVVSVTGGTHVIQLEYAKDDSVDEGLDDARVLSIEARTAGTVFQLGGADGAVAGGPVTGWLSTSSDAALEWETVQPMPSTVATKADDGTAKSIDGLLYDAEYANAVMVNLPDRSGTTKINTEVRFVRTASGGVALAFELADELAEWFQNAGQMAFWVSASEFGDPANPDCSGGKSLPGPHARKFEVTWTGSANPTVVQSIGQCDALNPWKIASTEESWAFSAVMGADTDDDTDITGALVEVGIEPTRPVGAASNAPLAMMFRVLAEVPSLGLTTIAEFPRRAQPVLTESEPAVWGEVWLGATDFEPLPILGM